METMKTLLAMVVVIGLVGSAEAQTLHRYLDDKGEVHITDDPNKIPRAKGGKGEATDGPRQPPRQMKDEHLLYTLPTGFKLAFQDRQGNVQLSEAVPQSENVKNWTEMVTSTIHFGTKNMTPEQFQVGMKGAWLAVCKDGDHFALHSGKERGYPVSVFRLGCPLNPATGKPEYTWFKAMQGNDSFYVVQKAYTSVPTNEQAAAAVDFLRRVWVCDSRLPDRVCPTVRRD